MKVVIGLVGEKAGGKGTFTEFLKFLLPQKKIVHAKFSDLLFETLKLWGLEISRENLQKLSVAIRDAFGEGTLTRAIQRRVENLDADIVILDGVRWESDVKLLRSFPANFLVYVTADPRTRYARSRKRNEKAGEGQASFDQFLQEERAETEKYIPQIGAAADFTIANDDFPEEFHGKIKEFCTAFLI